jgi:hypothetical protein
MTKQISASVVEVRDPSAADEITDGSFARTVEDTIAALLQYDADGNIPTRSATGLDTAARSVIEIAGATAGPDIIGIVTTGDTRGVNKAGVASILEQLDAETMVVIVVHSNQAGDVDKAFFDALDNDHSKRKQIDVIYADEEKVADVIGREVDEFLANLADA